MVAEAWDTGAFCELQRSRLRHAPLPPPQDQSWPLGWAALCLLSSLLQISLAGETPFGAKLQGEWKADTENQGFALQPPPPRLFPLSRGKKFFNESTTIKIKIVLLKGSNSLFSITLGHTKLNSNQIAWVSETLC